MNTRRVAVILIAVAFVLVTAFSGVALFSVKEINVSYSLLSEENSKTDKVEKTLEEYMGKNLMFVDKNEITSKVESNHYLEVISVDKQFPNVLKVTVKERKPVYVIENAGNYYSTTAEGFVVEKKNAFEQTRGDIYLDISALNVLSIEEGDVVKTEDDELLLDVYKMAKAVNLTDCVNKIVVEKATEFITVNFFTYTGVKIKIDVTPDYNVENGDAVLFESEKAVHAFYAYDALLSDYEKTYGVIDMIRMKNGLYRVTYNNYEIYTAE